jgi:hypothetical protein
VRSTDHLQLFERILCEDGQYSRSC